MTATVPRSSRKATTAARQSAEAAPSGPDYVLLAGSRWSRALIYGDESTSVPEESGA
jgi:hypothetical protein